MYLRPKTKPHPGLITQYPWNLFYFIPIRMGTAVRVTGFAVWSQQNLVCSLRSAFSVDAPLPGPRCQHLKKKYYTLGKKKIYILQQQSIHPNLYLPWQPLLFHPGFRLDSSRRYILKTHNPEFCISPFPTMLSCVFVPEVPSESIYHKPLTAKPAFSVPHILSDPRLCTLVTSRPHSELSTSCLIPVVSLPFHFCRPSTCYRIIGTSFWLQEERLSKAIYYFVTEV